MTPSSFRKVNALVRGTCLGLLLLACTSAWAQVEANDAAAANEPPAEDTQLLVPPPVNGEAYPTEFAGDTEANYWTAGFNLSSAYSTNVTGAGSAHPAGDMSYSFWPSLAINKATPRLHLLFSYSPGFTIYQHTSSLNQFDQNLTANIQYSLSPNLSLSLQESFQQTSNVFNQPNPLFSTPVSGSVPIQHIAVVAPSAEFFTNGTSAQLNYQVSANGILGGSGTFGNQYYPNPSEVPGLYNSRSEGASLFYSHRLGDRYYVGGTYQYQHTLAYQASAPGPQTATQTQTIFAFMSVYLKPTLSLSVSGGPQHYSATQTPLPTSQAWSPLTMVSINWQGERTTLAANYARIVTGAGGLNGAYHSNSAGVSANWQLTRTWTAGASASYATYATVTPLFILSSPGGHTILGTASAQHMLSDHLNLQLGYNWVHQEYQGVTQLGTPNTSRVFFSINYQFTRPLQR